MPRQLYWTTTDELRFLAELGEHTPWRRRGPVRPVDRISRLLQYREHLRLGRRWDDEVNVQTVAAVVDLWIEWWSRQRT